MLTVSALSQFRVGVKNNNCSSSSGVCVGEGGGRGWVGWWGVCVRACVCVWGGGGACVRAHAFSCDIWIAA